MDQGYCPGNKSGGVKLGTALSFRGLISHFLPLIRRHFPTDALIKTGCQILLS